MHSPIIYLINDDENYNGQLPKDDVPFFDEEDFVNSISESDYVTLDISENKNWHRNNWLDDLNSMFENNPYVTFNNDVNPTLTITNDNLTAWFKDVLNITEKYQTGIKNYLNGQSKNSIEFPFDNIKDTITFRDMVEKPYGGVRFIIFEKYNNEWQYPQIESLKSLIDNNKFTPNVTYQICTNIVGDYHH